MLPQVHFCLIGIVAAVNAAPAAVKVKGKVNVSVFFETP